MARTLSASDQPVNRPMRAGPIYRNVEKECGEIISRMLLSKRAIPGYIIDLSCCSHGGAGGPKRMNNEEAGNLSPLRMWAMDRLTSRCRFSCLLR
jgi:hypothetical protein